MSVGTTIHPGFEAQKYGENESCRTLQKPISQHGGCTEFGMSVTGVMTERDVRLAANTRAELNLRLKIDVAKRRIYLGDLLEGLLGAGILKQRRSMPCLH